MPAGESKIRVFNGFNCNIKMNSKNITVHNLSSMGILEINYTAVSNEKLLPVEFSLKNNPLCSSNFTTFNLTSSVEIVEGKVSI